MSVIKNYVKPVIPHAQEMKERRERQLAAVPTTFNKAAFRLRRKEDGIYLAHRNRYTLSGPDANVKQPRDVLWETPIV